jgi:hypothetical protein
MRVCLWLPAVAILFASGCTILVHEPVQPPPAMAYVSMRANDWETIRLQPREVAMVENTTLFVTVRTVSGLPCIDDMTCGPADREVVIGTAAGGGEWSWHTLNSASGTVEVIAGQHAIRLVEVEPAWTPLEAGAASGWAVSLRIMPWPPTGRRSQRGLFADAR